jgi:hypothetical protein
MSINERLDAFISCNSLTNARLLLAHFNRNPADLDILTDDHAGQVRNAERMVETDKLSRRADNMRFSRR